MLLAVLRCLLFAALGYNVGEDLFAPVRFLPCMDNSLVSLTCASGASESLRTNLGFADLTSIIFLLEGFRYSSDASRYASQFCTKLT